MPENVEAWNLYQLVADQQDRGMGAYGPIRIEAVEVIFRWYEVENEREMFEKIRLIHSIYMDIKSKESD